MPTTTRQGQGAMHLAEYCTYVRSHYERDGGRRLEFACPSASGGPEHRFFVDEDGGRPSCDCRAVAHRGHCTLTSNSVLVVKLHYEREAAAMSDLDLADDDRWSQRKSLTHRMTDAELLRWRAIRDELDRRHEAWEARNIADDGRYAPLGAA
jgi:hypothetical protein